MATEDLNPELSGLVRALKEERGPCPPADALVEYQGSSADQRSAHPVHRHLEICSRCQLVLLHLEEPARRATARWPYAAAAAVLLAVAGPALYQLTRAPPPETIRGSDLQPIAPSGEVAAVPSFEWQSPVRAAKYRVRVYRGREKIWESTSLSTSLPLPAGAPLLRGVEYRWTVEALDAAGDVRLTSPPQPFVLTR